jgi:hypothetical protein
MDSIGNFAPKIVSFVAKQKNIVVFAFTCVLESFGLFYADFCMDLYNAESDEARR